MLSEKKFVELAKVKYAIINELKDAPDMLDYERGLQEVMNEFACSIMEEQLGGATKDRRKKNRRHDLRESESAQNPLVESRHGKWHEHFTFVVKSLLTLRGRSSTIQSCRAF